MNFREYQIEATKTIDRELSLREMLLQAVVGLTGELGEIAEPIKKHFWHNKPADWDALMLEAGDMMWYLNELLLAITALKAQESGRAIDPFTSMETAALCNIAKLRARHGETFTTKEAGHGDD